MRYRNLYALVPVPVRIEILNPDTPEEEQVEKRIPEPQFPTRPAGIFYEMTLDLRLCKKDEKDEEILFGVVIFETDWLAWQKAEGAGKIKIFESWDAVLREYMAQIKPRINRVPCRKGTQRAWRRKPELTLEPLQGKGKQPQPPPSIEKWEELNVPGRIGSILGVEEF